MGSRLTRANGDRWSSQVVVTGLTASLKVTRSVWFPASMKVLPVLQSTPMEGSPAPCVLAVVDTGVAGMQAGGGFGGVESSRAGYLVKVSDPGGGGGGGGVAWPGSLGL